MVLVLMALAGYPGVSNAAASKEAFISVTHTVKTGETLYGIARKFYLTGDYVQVAKWNGLDPKGEPESGNGAEAVESADHG